jgi:hypothetical protein
VQTKENIRKDPIQTHKQENDRAPAETKQNTRNDVLQPWTNNYRPIQTYKLQAKYKIYRKKEKRQVAYGIGTTYMTSV